MSAFGRSSAFRTVMNVVNGHRGLMWLKSHIGHAALFVPSLAGPVYARFLHLPLIHDKQDTLDYLVENKTSLSRLGDGEMKIICGNSIGFQEYSATLSARLTEVLQTRMRDHVCCIPRALVDRHDYVWRSQVSFRIHLMEFGRAWSTLCTQPEYYDTNVSRPYLVYRPKYFNTNYFAQFRLVWQRRNVVFVNGEHTHLGEHNDLFTGASSYQRVIGPAKNAWNHYDSILAQCMTIANTVDDPLFLVALGPTATVLAFDLARHGIQALDIGHLDIEYEWYLRGVRRKIPIPGKWVHEAGGLTERSDPNDS